jgi:hypothetical protein
LEKNVSGPPGGLRIHNEDSKEEKMRKLTLDGKVIQDNSDCYVIRNETIEACLPKPDITSPTIILTAMVKLMVNIGSF